MTPLLWFTFGYAAGIGVALLWFSFGSRHSRRWRGRRRH